MSKNYAVLSIDNEKAETRRILDFSTGPYYMIGGGIYGTKGFIGCMRHITIDGNYKLPGVNFTNILRAAFKSANP
jgi:contactin associated protein-like 2